MTNLLDNEAGQGAGPGQRGNCHPIQGQWVPGREASETKGRLGLGVSWGRMWTNGFIN